MVKIPTILNALTVDVEDYFHVEAFASSISPSDWDSCPPRVETNVRRILALFEQHHVKATFFILGWIAARFPDLVRDIAACGHEVGCHGFDHQHIRRLSADEFRDDLRSARDLLANLARREIIAYRAPSFSIVKETLWGLDVLAEEGFRIDSSIYPGRHDLYGLPDAPRFPHWRGALFEFPPSTVRLLGNNVGGVGGGYLRILPYWWTRWAMKRINRKEKQPAMVYFHPWEIDPGQPRIRAPLRSRLRHYTNLAVMESKLNRLLQEFKFDTLSRVCASLDSYGRGTEPRS